MDNGCDVDAGTGSGMTLESSDWKRADPADAAKEKRVVGIGTAG